MMTKSDFPSRRGALKCLAYGGAGTLFTLSGGVLLATDLADASTMKMHGGHVGTPLFVQISDTHIGFNKDANPDVAGTLKQSIAMINAMPQKPSLILHTGDITQLARPDQFDTAAQILSGLNVSEIHYTPGEHDTADAGGGKEFMDRFGKPSNNKGYYSFDSEGVHFIALINVLDFKPGGLGILGNDQLAWLKDDLTGRSSSQPIVVFAHMPLWTIYEPWGWGTGDAEQAFALLRRFGSVTVLNGHIHQIVSKVEGNITFQTARATCFPQPKAGDGPGPGPLKVDASVLPTMLGIRSITYKPHPATMTVKDISLA
jgi:3',5'-cyclic AMP phosphodiesterase CpdA